MAAGHHDTFHHVRDFPYFELSETLGIGKDILDAEGHKIAFGIELPSLLGFQITKFMVLQVVAGLLTLLIFRGLSKRVNATSAVSGRFWNFWEAIAIYIRDKVVRPTIGEGHHHDEHDGHGHSEPHVAADHHEVAVGHPADKYLPFVWTCFFYVLFCNLLGAIPWLGSATGEINVTVALALVVFGTVVVAGSQELGAVEFWKAICPSMDLPGSLKIALVPMIWVIELLGLFIKHGVLAVRLFANIMAGHTVIAVILGFIAAVSGSWLYYLVLPASILGQIGIGMLELFFAFLQAYIFAFLAALFIGTAVHPH